MQYQHTVNTGQYKHYVYLGAQAFGADESDCLRRTPRTVVRTVSDKNAVVGGLSLFRAGQWFGGNRLESGLIAGVAIAPEARGSGAGRELMQGLLQELHDNRVPVSALYASTTAFYRKLGYGLAGDYSRWDVPAGALPVRPQQQAPQDQPMAVVQLDAANKAAQSAVKSVYTEWSRLYSGMIDRPDDFWQLILTPHKKKVYLFLACSDPADPCATAQGYALIDHERKDHRIEVLDTAANSPEAADALLALLAGHRSVTDHVRIAGPACSPLLLRIPDHSRIARCDSEPWLLRLTHIPAALEQRGYPAVSAELRIDVTDSILAGNNGSLLLQLRHGKPKLIVEKLKDDFDSDPDPQRSHIALSAEALAVLFADGQRASILAAAGMLRGSKDSIRIAQTIFSGGPAVLQDKF